ncbi:MAG: hypothetical protein ABJP82_11495 [Hyphomicrobiales bacterium]
MDSKQEFTLDLNVLDRAFVDTTFKLKTLSLINNFLARKGGYDPGGRVGFHLENRVSKAVVMALRRLVRSISAVNSP